MKQSALDKGEEEAIKSPTQHAFKPVGKVKESAKTQEEEPGIAHNLRRSARMNAKTGRQNGKNASSFQRSASSDDRSGSISINDCNDSIADKPEINPHK